MDTMPRYISATIILACLTIASSASAEDDYTLLDVGEDKKHELAIDIDDEVTEDVTIRMRAALGGYNAEMRKCVGKAASGSAELNIHIASDGSVEKVDVKKDTSKNGLATCLGGVLDGLDFSKDAQQRVIGIAVELRKREPNDHKLVVGRGSGGMGLRSSNEDGFGRIGGVEKDDGDQTQPKSRNLSPKMKLEVVSVDGPHDKEAVEKSVRRKGNALRYCYEKQLQRNPDLSGKVRAQFDVTEKGRSTNAKVASSTLEDSKVESCLLRVMVRMRLTKADRASKVTTTMTFEGVDRD
jgi:hypothetical protein